MIEDYRDLEPIPENGNDFIADVSNCPDLTLLWEQILLKNEKGELTSYEKHSLCEALNYMERKGMITLKFGI